MNTVNVKIDFTNCKNTLDIMNTFSSSLGLGKFGNESWDALWDYLCNLDAYSNLFNDTSNTPDVIHLILCNYQRVKEVSDHTIIIKGEMYNQYLTLNKILVELTEKKATYDSNIS